MSKRARAHTYTYILLEDSAKKTDLAKCDLKLKGISTTFQVISLYYILKDFENSKGKFI